MLKICGYGSHSTVYRKESEAIKVITRTIRNAGIYYPLEYNIVLSLHHPHIIQAKEITADGSLVFPYYPYTLHSPEVLTLPIKKRWQLLKHVFSAIDALHRCGYLHLDIKGDNILVSSDLESAVLADFGNSCIIGYPSSRERIIDDLKSPQLLKYKLEKRNKIQYTKEDDYWSLGILCLEVLNGRMPTYRHSSVDELLRNRKKVIRNEIKFIPVEYRNVVESLLKWDSKERVLTSLSSAIQEDVDFTGRCMWKGDLLRTLMYWVQRAGDEDIDVFFLACQLYTRCYLEITDEYLFTTCFWMSLKMIESASINLSELEIDSLKVIDLEIRIIQHLGGKLHSSFHPIPSHMRWRNLYSERPLILEDNKRSSKETLAMFAHRKETLAMFAHRMDFFIFF